MQINLGNIVDFDNGSMKRIDVVVNEKSLRFCVINIEDVVYVIDDKCSHADFSLSEGFLNEDAREVECPKHSAVFDLETGKAKCLPATQPVSTYKARIEDANVYIELEDNNV